MEPMFKVLVVDDEQPVRAMLAKLFERRGFSVVTADSAASGRAMLCQEKLDLVVTDLRMESPLAGFDLVKAANQIVPRPVIVVLTAFPVPAEEWRNAGADALVVKGMRVGTLVMELEEILKQRAA